MLKYFLTCADALFLKMTYFIFKIQNTVSSRVVPIQRGNDVIPLRMNKPGDCRVLRTRKDTIFSLLKNKNHVFTNPNIYVGVK